MIFIINWVILFISNKWCFTTNDLHLFAREKSKKYTLFFHFIKISSDTKIFLNWIFQVTSFSYRLLQLLTINFNIFLRQLQILNNPKPDFNCMSVNYSEFL